MKRKVGFIASSIVLILGVALYCIMSSEKEVLREMNATILSVNDEYVIVQDQDQVTYQFKIDDFILDVGDRVVIQYTGLLDSTKDVQDISIKNYSRSSNQKSTPSWTQTGIFKDYYTFANNKLETMSLEEKIGQLFLVQLPDNNAVEAVKMNQFGGYLLFKKDFDGKTKQEVVNMIKELQAASKIPLLIAVDEEGGSVVRVSSNSNLRDTPFLSPKELYQAGGMEKIKEDTVEKSILLDSLGINLNLAPVIDVSTNSSDYMNPRTIGENTTITSEYAKTVIEASKGGKVSYTLKHFPGYGNNIDTHTGVSNDYRTYDSILTNDLPPFKSGIQAGAEAVLVSHNIVHNIDSSNPASLSIPIHNLLREDLGFTGIIITDDLSMKALDSLSNPVTTALLAGNDILIVSDYANSIQEVKDALENKTISEELINDRVLRILAWKYYKGMIYENQK